MRREFGFVDFARYRRGDNGRGILVADIVLYDEYGAYSALLASHDGGSIRIIQFTAFYVHNIPLLKTEQLPYYIVCNLVVWRSVFRFAV